MIYLLKPGPHGGTWIVDEMGKVIVWCHTLEYALQYVKEKLS
jgi:hypothetical protein